MWSIDKVQQAWRLASLHHKGQQYAGPQEGQYFEYMNHIGSVTFEIMQALLEHPERDGTLAVLCAILHDTVEDTTLKLEEIGSEFGEKVAAGVSALTKSDALEGKRAKMEDSLRRIRKQPKEVWMVKLADRVTNLSPPPFYWKKEKIKAYWEEAQLINEALKEGSPVLADRLQMKMENYKQYFL